MADSFDDEELLGVDLSCFDLPRLPPAPMTASSVATSAALSSVIPLDRDDNAGDCIICDEGFGDGGGGGRAANAGDTLSCGTVTGTGASSSFGTMSNTRTEPDSTGLSAVAADGAAPSVCHLSGAGVSTAPHCSDFHVNTSSASLSGSVGRPASTSCAAATSSTPASITTAASARCAVLRRQYPLLRSLDNDQISAAASDPDRPLAIIAGPGSGKTRTVLARVCHLMAAHGACAEDITCITFTRTAAAEMRSRLSDSGTGAGPDAARQVWIGTFHAFASQLLRRFARGRQPQQQQAQAEVIASAGPGAAAFTSDFRMLSARDAEAIMVTAMKSLVAEGDTSAGEGARAAPSVALVALAKACATPKTALQLARWYLAEWRDARMRCASPSDYAAPASSLFAGYDAACAAENAMDFVDLIRHATGLLDSSPGARTYVGGKCRNLVVDEVGGRGRRRSLLVGKE